MIQGRTAFIVGGSLLCATQVIDLAVVWHFGFSWWYPIIGTGLMVNLGYCAWRGEKWAFYLLLTLGVASLLPFGIRILAASTAMMVVLYVVVSMMLLLGILLLVGHPRVSEFLDTQRLKYDSANP